MNVRVDTGLARSARHMTEPACVFETPRLRARHIDAADVDAMLAVYGDPEVVRWVADGLPLQRKRCEEWVDVTRRNYATRGYGMVALVERDSGDIVGLCGLVHPAGQQVPEAKYALRRGQWGKGFATEALTGLLRYGASEFGMKEVIATTAPENVASHRVLLKAGMQRDALRNNDYGSFTQLFVWRPADVEVRG
jgi:RimJ/RimL family protein N-acetyltransferase